MRKGSWHDINWAMSKEEIENEFVTVYIDHGVKPKNEGYAYAVLPCVDISELSDEIPVVIIKQDEYAHAVFDKKIGITAINFWRDEFVKVKSISCDKKASVILRETESECKISISDPTMLNKDTITLQFFGEVKDVVSKDNEISYQMFDGGIEIEADVLNSYGQPFSIAFKKNDNLTDLYHHTGEPDKNKAEDLAEITRDYYGAVSGLDYNIGRILDYIKSKNIYNDTLIVISSDHGDMLGSHGLMGKYVWYEESVGIPLIIGGAGIHSMKTNELIGSVDHAPTVLGMLGVDIPQSMEGKDFSPLIRGNSFEGYNSIMTAGFPNSVERIKEFEKHGENPLDYGWRSIIIQDYKLAVHKGYSYGEEERRFLYDLKNDPYEKFPVNDEQKIGELMGELKKWCKKIDENLEDFTYKFPSSFTENKMYSQTENTDWTESFWTGMVWLAYELTGDEKYRKAGDIHVESFRNRIDNNIAVDHHDLGFLYTLSCIACYKLTGSEFAKETALKAADKLMTRYKEKGEFIQAWGAIDDPKAYRLIIDCMMNLPLLYWASEVTGDKKYYDIAYKHAKTTARNIVREDASTFHTFYFDPQTGEPLDGVTHQGFSDDSCWARGQAWGVYGFALSYVYTKDEVFTDLYKKVTNYFLNRLPEDYVAYWDLIFNDGSGEERDSSLSAIAVCGSHACVEFLNAGYDVTVVDNLSNSKEESLKRVEKITGKKITFHKVDLLDYDALENVFKNETFDGVIHFAGLKAVGESVSVPLKYYHNNITGTLNLCDLMGKYNVKNLVFSSSATVYGDPASVPIAEDFPLSATNPYGQTKLMIEYILKDLYKSDNSWNISLLRYFNPVGAHKSGLIGEDPSGIPNNLVPYITQVAIGKLDKLKVFGNDYDTKDGTGVRDYIHVVDLAQGHLNAYKKLEEAPGLIIHNLGTGTGYSVLSMVEAFKKASGKDIPYEIVGRRDGDIGECYADPSKAKAELGFIAKLGLDEMCEDSWRWQSNNPNGYEE
ncbi:udp-glucose 4-epimerase [Holotrichia oblita]|nr:udp-glucose 4-epimerase [Holotrichia oblita]